MFVFTKNDATKIDIEKEIMNSNTDYNVMAHNKEQIENKDILKEHLEAQKLDLSQKISRV
ncbi:hypothetical protein AYJ08_20655 [Brevibacillus sp. SKDU10]|uniref:hypothetical protein n=1 Tax=Brevibacillus sp. SKDU10 TaxID=1247872 RepID=UPI0007C8E902|nr:hypothetical protein [Brevibacillus sp. SKDU10]OAJ75855.1 hypothetical protein AYJ08_20655 [Brevibacillus sp. SKDU10]